MTTEHLQLDNDERNELDVLRLENDTLRRNLGKLEEKVQNAEERCALKLQQQQEKKQVQRASATSGSSAVGQAEGVGELNHLHSILQWLQQAKADIVENDRSKVELEGDVRLLYDLLERARRERKSFEDVVSRLERSILDSKSRIAELEDKSRLLRRSFEQILRRDRDFYEARTDAAEMIAERRGQELVKLMDWVEKAGSKYADALRRMSAQAEEVGAANLGDLEGFARDIMKEVHQLREGVAAAMRPLKIDGNRARRNKGSDAPRSVLEPRAQHTTKNSKTTKKGKAGTAPPTDDDAGGDAGRGDGGDSVDEKN